jgi:hypothetical protein
MHYVVLATHNADICPMSNAKTQAMILEMGPQIPKIAEKHAVNIVSGPWVNREHQTVVIVETERAESLDAFLVESRLAQWNAVRVLPSQHLAEGMKEVGEATALF